MNFIVDSIDRVLSNLQHRVCHGRDRGNLMEQLAPRQQIAKAPRSVFVGSLFRRVAAMKLRLFMSESSSPDHFSCRCASAATGVCQHPRRQ